MYRAIPFARGISADRHLLAGPSPTTTPATDESDRIKKVVSESPVAVVGRRGCCMCHVVRQLLQGLGVNPVVCEVRDDVDEMAIATELGGERVMFPAVFIGGRLVGGLDRLMAAHISGDLVPILKDAGALWL